MNLGFIGVMGYKNSGILYDELLMLWNKRNTR